MADYNCEFGANKKCPVCGKPFFVPSYMRESYAYKIRKKYFCSYTCFRKSDPKPIRRRVSKVIE